MRKNLKKDVESLTKDFVGYGHYQLNVTMKDGLQLSAVTGDTELISNLNSLLDDEREKAEEEAINYVLKNGK